MKLFKEVFGRIAAEPFVPFQMHLTNGRILIVPHPELIHVGRTYFTIFTAAENDPDGPENFEEMPLALIESFAPLNIPVKS